MMEKSKINAAVYIVVFLLTWIVAAFVTCAEAENVTIQQKTEANVVNSFPPPSATSTTSSDTEKQAYCRNIQDMAEAEDKLDTGISINGRYGKSAENPGQTQTVIGVQKSLSKHLQGNSALRIGKLSCDLYDHNLDVQLITKYKLAFIEQQTAKQQVIELQNILRLIDAEIAVTERRQYTGNATLTDVIALSQQRQTIYEQYIIAQNNALVPTIPKIPEIDVQKAMRQVDDLSRALQEELNYKQELQAWDIALIAGWQKPTSPSTGSGTADIPPYGVQTIPYTINGKAQNFVAVTFTYNINMEPYKHKLADSVDSLMAYRRQQNDGLNRQVENLQKNIFDVLNLQQNSLVQIDHQINHFNADLKRLRGLQSVDALKLITQIRINLAIATMEDHLAKFRIKLLSTHNHA